MSKCFVFRVVAAVLWFLGLVEATACVAASTAGAIARVGFDRRDMRENDVVTVRIAVSPKTGVWKVGSYVARVTLAGQDGLVVARATDVVGDEPTAAGQIVGLFAPVHLPPQVSGPLAVHVILLHAGVIAGDVTTTLVVGTGASGRAASTSSAITASFSGTQNYADRQTQQSSYTLGARLADGTSVSGTFGLSSTPSTVKPLVGVQTATALAQIGTFAPSYNAAVLDAVSGTGFTYRQLVGAGAVQFAYLSGAHTTANPFALAAIDVERDVLGGTFGVLVGEVNVDGPTQRVGTAYFLRHGTFAGLQYAARPTNAGFSYALRYGTIDYFDDLIGHRRTDRVYAATSSFTIDRLAMTLDLVRAGPYYPALAVPKITPDRETATLAARVPIGAILVNGAVTEYRDALNGSIATQQTHYWTESLGAEYRPTPRDVLGVHVSNAVQHLQGSLIGFNGNDTTGITYTALRGPYGATVTVGSANQRSSTGLLTHTIQDGITVTRTVGQGVSLNGGFNLSNLAANQRVAASVGDAVFAGAGFTRGATTYSASIQQALTRPALGVAEPAALALGFGIALRPTPAFPYGFSLSALEGRGATNATTGSLNLTRSL